MTPSLWYSKSMPIPALNRAPCGRWTLRDIAAQRRSPLREAPMTPFHLLAALLVSLSLATSTAAAAIGVGEFSTLKDREEMQVAFEARGCFQHDSYELIFTRLENNLSMKQQKITILRERSELGVLNLSEADVAGLDWLLRYYRSSPPGGCTTVDRVTISRRQNGNVIATETLEDSSCAVEKEQVTQIPELVRRFRTSNQSKPQTQGQEDTR